MKKPLVSVVITTFQHEGFIGSCLRSAVSQKCDFDFEIVVGEDCSTDGTRKVVEQIVAEFPSIIYPVFQPSNTGGHGNFLSCLSLARGEWIAWLEGDDVWTDELKLAKQMRKLRENPGSVVCFTNARKFLSGTPVQHGEPLVDKGFFSEGLIARDSLLYGNFIPTCTVVFLKESVYPLPEWYTELPLGDWSLLLIALQKGPAYYLDQFTAGYRVHAGGQWSQNDSLRASNKMVEVCQRLRIEFGATSDRRRLSSILSIWYVRRAVAKARSGRFVVASRDVFDALITFLESDWWNMRRISFLTKKIFSKFL